MSAGRRAGDRNEAGQLADRLKDPLLAGHAAYAGTLDAMEAGDLEHADPLLANSAPPPSSSASPGMRWYAAIARATRCLISGPAEEAERLAFAALELGRSAEQPDSRLLFHGQLTSRASCRDRWIAVIRTSPTSSRTRPTSSKSLACRCRTTRRSPRAAAAARDRRQDEAILCEVGESTTRGRTSSWS